MPDPIEPEYYENDGWTYAFMGTWGAYGLFRLDPDGSTWTYHPANDLVWDSCHQETYDNHKSSRLDAAAIRRLPPLPPLPAVTSVRWEDHWALTKTNLLRTPALVGWVRACPGGVATAHYVLYEDPYESSFGDGTFRYLQDVFLSADEARAWTASPEAVNSGMRHHLRSLQVVAKGDRLELEVFAPHVFDHVKADEIVERLVEKLKARGNG